MVDDRKKAVAKHLDDDATTTMVVADPYEHLPLADSEEATRMMPGKDSRTYPKPTASGAFGELHNQHTMVDNSDPWIGRIIDGRYRITGILGEGGMGSVFIAEHLKLKKMVALKAVHPEFSGDGEMATRFAREAMATAQIEHPHIANALDFGTLPEGGAYLVMQLVQGKSIQEILEKVGPMKWPRACEIAAQTADALAAAHHVGIVHRDLKPENVLLEPRDEGVENVKVLDFGIARVPTDASAAPAGAAPKRSITRVGTVMGTPGYMSPEQAVGDRIDHRTDLYALGVILWEMITGVQLFPGEDLTEIVSHQLGEEPPLLSEFCDDTTIPVALQDYINRLLAKKPKNRPDAATVVRDTLRQFVADTSAINRTRVSLTSAPMAEDNPVEKIKAGVAQLFAIAKEDAPSKIEELKAKLPFPLPVVGVGCALLAVLAVGSLGYLIFSGDEEQAQTQIQAPRDENGELVEPITPVPSTATEFAPTNEGVLSMLDEVMAGAERDERVATAKKLQSNPGQLPAWGDAVVRLELARGCPAKRNVLKELQLLGDPGALPIVERLDQTSKTGCGRRRRKNRRRSADCLACIRSDIKETLKVLNQH